LTSPDRTHEFAAEQGRRSLSTHPSSEFAGQTSGRTRPVRYGMFLRPDPRTCWHITQATSALRAQFGLISAGAFPPHATLIGNLCTEHGESDLTAVIDPVLSSLTAFPVYNSGLARGTNNGHTTYEYNINLDPTTTLPNVDLNRVAKAVKAAVLPLSKPVRDRFSTPVADYEFAGHLGIASHELMIDGHLSEEVGEYLHQLPIDPPPAMFMARWFTLYAITSADWGGNWWESLAWRVVRSWRATEPPKAASTLAE